MCVRSQVGSRSLMLFRSSSTAPTNST
jgi:hypothetical protein